VSEISLNCVMMILFQLVGQNNQCTLLSFMIIIINHTVLLDIIILSTSEPNSLCYVETKNLDGETNLKIRSSVPEIDHLSTPEDCAQIRFYVDSEPPTTNLFSYNATLVFPSGLPDRPRYRGGPIKIPINLNSMLLRGCVLKNTEWVIGLVVFTGSDTKLSLNSGATPSKRSRIEKMMNPQVYVIYLFLFT
jgi:phospholipid-translocating ATPase